MQDIEIVTRASGGCLMVRGDNDSLLDMITVEAYAHTPAGKLEVRLPATREMIEDLPAEWFDEHLREAMNKMIATSDELLRYRISKLRERAALREAGGI